MDRRITLALTAVMIAMVVITLALAAFMIWGTMAVWGWIG